MMAATQVREVSFGQPVIYGGSVQGLVPSHACVQAQLPSHACVQAQLASRVEHIVIPLHQGLLIHAFRASGIIHSCVPCMTKCSCFRVFCCAHIQPSVQAADVLTLYCTIQPSVQAADALTLYCTIQPSVQAADALTTMKRLQRCESKPVATDDTINSEENGLGNVEGRLEEESYWQLDVSMHSLSGDPADGTVMLMADSAEASKALQEIGSSWANTEEQTPDAHQYAQVAARKRTDTLAAGSTAATALAATSPEEEAPPGGRTRAVAGVPAEEEAGAVAGMRAEEKVMKPQ